MDLSPASGVAGLTAPPPLEQLHPALWRAHQVAQQRDPVCASGFAELDAQLPGGGWPTRALAELLLPHPGIGELRLLAPALAAVQATGRSVIWLDPPARPCPWTLAALGLDLRLLVLVQGREAASHALWAAEHALGSGHAGAVLAWLPARVRSETLRRLQLAAQAHDGPAWLLRHAAPQAPAARAALPLHPSPAPLRLRLAPAAPDELLLHIVKRRGPPPLQPLRLALTPVLAAPARARALRSAPARQDGPTFAPARQDGPMPTSVPSPAPARPVSSI